MLATILKSKKATDTTIAIIEAFYKLRAISGALSTLNPTSDSNQQKKVSEQTSRIISDLLGDELQVRDTETTIEINFAVVKLKHTIKRKP